MEERVEEQSITQKIVYFLAGTTVFLVIFSFVFLFYSEKSLEKKKKEYEAKLMELKSKGEIKDLELKLKLIQAQLQTAETLAKEKYFSQKFLEFLEKNKVKGVQFNGISIDFEKKSVSLSGQGQDFSSVAKQLKLFENLPELKNFTIPKVGPSQDGKVNFDCSFNFQDNLIK